MGNATQSASRYSQASDATEWAAFDSLPRKVRDALNYGEFDWAAYPIARRFRSSNRHDEAKRIVADIAAWNRKHVKKDAKRVWGRA